ASQQRRAAAPGLRRVPAELPRPRRYPPSQRGDVPLLPAVGRGAGRRRAGPALPAAAAAGGGLFPGRQFHPAPGAGGAGGRHPAGACGGGLPGPGPGPHPADLRDRPAALPLVLHAQVAALAAAQARAVPAAARLRRRRAAPGHAPPDPLDGAAAYADVRHRGVLRRLQHRRRSPGPPAGAGECAGGRRRPGHSLRRLPGPAPAAALPAGVRRGRRPLRFPRGPGPERLRRTLGGRPPGSRGHGRRGRPRYNPRFISCLNLPMSTQITEALARGDVAAALASARRLTESQPDNAEAQHLLGLALQRNGEFAAAQAAFARAAALAPENPAYPFAVASLAISRGDLDTAERHAKLAAGLDPNHLPAYVIAGQATLMRRDRVEAARQLRMAQRINPEHPWVKVLEGYLARYDGDEDKAMACFTAAAKLDPALPSAQLALGLGYLKKDMLAFAEQALRNAHTHAPNNLAVAQDLLEALRRQGKMAEALAVIGPLVASIPHDPSLRLLRAELLGVNGRAAEGLEEALALVRAHPTHLRTLGSTLELLRLNGREAEGVELVEEALRQAPQETRLWSLRGALAANLGEDPVAVLKRWTEAQPDSAVAWEQLAGLHEARGELEPMAEAAERALALQPGLIGASLLFAKGRLEQAPAQVLERLETALVANPELPAPNRRAVLGWQSLALDRLGRYADAAERMRQSAAMPILRQQPLPKLRPAEGEPAAAAGTLLWTLP